MGDNIGISSYRTLPYNAVSAVSLTLLYHVLDPEHSVVTGFQCIYLFINVLMIGNLRPALHHMMIIECASTFTASILPMYVSKQLFTFRNATSRSSTKMDSNSPNRSCQIPNMQSMEVSSECYTFMLIH